MNYNHGDGVVPPKKYRLPAWVWIISILGLLFAVNGGYQSGQMTSEIISFLNVSDTTADTSLLGKLDFNDCIEEHKSSDNLCDLDYSGIFALTYQAKVNGVRESKFNNDYTDRSTVSVAATVSSMTYYDVRYVNMNTLGKDSLSYKINIALSSGNMEAAILAIDKAYTCTVKDGDRVINAEYITKVERINGSAEGTLSLDQSKIYVIVFGAENATGSYTLDVTLSENGGDTEL